MKEISLKILDIDCAACVSTLDSVLSEIPGVRSAAVNYASGSAAICYDDAVLSLSEIVTQVKKTGFRVPEEEADLLPVQKDSARESAAVGLLRNVFGVHNVERSESGTLTVTLWPVGVESRDLIAACREAGLEVTLRDLRGGDEDQDIVKRMDLLKILIASAACTAPLMWELSPKLQFAIGTVLQFGPGRYFYKGALRGLRNRSFGMDLLVSLSSTLIYLYSTYVVFTAKDVFKLYYMADGVLLSLILFGKYMEQVAAGEANSAIRKLMHLQPKTAMVWQDGEFVEKDVDRIVEHDIIQIRPGERIPVDGIILEGTCAVDESMLTGESIPVDKTEGDRVVGGSLNRAGSVKISASALGKDSVLQQIIDIVRKAQAEKAPVQRFADRIAQWFVPGVIGAAGLTFAAWYLAIRPHDLEKAILCCCDVLTVACPCALGLATPTGLMVGSGHAAESGILFKAGTQLENAWKADTVVFDKTGTLTRGIPEVTAVQSVGENDEMELITLAASLEYLSDHPLSRAVTEFASWRYPQSLPPHVEEFRSLPGQGVTGLVGGIRILCGNRRMMEEFGIDLSPLSSLPDLREEANTEICVARDKDLLGVIGVADRLKPEAYETVQALRRAGKEVWMMTGDNQRTAESVGRSAGIDRILYEVLPEQKAEQISALKKEGRNVCMVGDGINDTPALTEADCAVAMGTGSDIAIDSAGIILPSGSLSKIPEMFRISNSTIRIVRQNLKWALFYNLISIPIAATGVLHPSYCSTAMALSSIGVMLNSLRLREDEKKGKKKK